MTTEYWESRAVRYASEGRGLAAVCSYGMPDFYNNYIDLCQRRALQPWLQVPAGSEVMDLGCGVGRWSRYLAARGARVTGFDLSHQMLREAERRAAQEGLAERCTFRQADLAELEVDKQYSLILAVTVLQHILDETRLSEAVRRLAASLTPGGRLVLLEAAPSRQFARCNSSIFTARTVEQYLSVFRAHGMLPEAISGVDPMPLKTRFLPYYKGLPRPLALTGLALVTGASLPVDALLGRHMPQASWHKVMILKHE